MSLRPSSLAEDLPNSLAEDLRDTYNAVVDAEKGRWRRREEDVVEIQESQMEENFRKRRRVEVQAESSPGSSHGLTLEERLKYLPALMEGVQSDHSALQLQSTIQIRKLLCIAENPPIDEVIQSGAVPHFVNFLRSWDFPHLQFEAAWALTNIASGTSANTKVVIDHGSLPLLVKLLDSSIDDVREQAVWALSSIAADSPGYRDIVLANGALMPLLAQLNDHAKLSMLKIATRALYNFCEGKPPPEFELIKQALPVLYNLIRSNEEEVIILACWSISFLADGPNNKIQAVIEAEVLPRLVELLLHESSLVVAPALRTIANIVSGDYVQTQHVIDCGALPLILNLLAPIHTKNIKKEACWTISNIVAGSQEQIQAVIDANIINALVDLLQNAEFDIKKEAAWAIANMTAEATHDQIKFLVSQGCIKLLCDLLVCLEPRITFVCLEGLDYILKVGEAEKKLGNNGGINAFAKMVEEAQGLEKIKNLQSHENAQISEKIALMMASFWVDDVDVPL